MTVGVGGGLGEGRWGEGCGEGVTGEGLLRFWGHPTGECPHHTPARGAGRGDGQRDPELDWVDWEAWPGHPALLAETLRLGVSPEE